jgi:hypothetical protein
MIKIIFCLALFGQAVIYASAQCSTVCSSTQTLDYKTCTCIPTTNCQIISRDPDSCLNAPCDTLAQKAACPAKCYCDMPSAMTNCCAPCLNNGLLNKSNCACGCTADWTGPQCQYPVDPTQAVDDAYCSLVDCTKATTADYFRCPNKCGACKNKQCGNLGSVNPDCTCTCLDATLYDAANGCALIACNDSTYCTSRQFLDPVTHTLDCTSLLTATLCPKHCAKC